METWRKDIGSVEGAADMAVRVSGDSAQLRTWARRPGYSWPCSVLARRQHVLAVLDPRNGDLIDLEEACDSGAFEGDEISGDELTAWIDDNLAGTPFAHLARTLQPCRACGVSFPFDPEADYCPACASVNAGDDARISRVTSMRPDGTVYHHPPREEVNA